MDVYDLNKYIDRSLTIEELEKQSSSDIWFDYESFYAEMAAHPSVCKLVEVGVWKGHSLSYLVRKLQENKDKRFICFAVDAWEKLDKSNPLWETHKETIPNLYSIYNYVMTITNTRKDVFDVKGDSVSASKCFENEYFDFCFLDASHDEKSVYLDLEAWYPKVRKGGVIAGHDIDCPGVAKAISAFDFRSEIRKNGIEHIWAVCKPL